VHVPPQIKSWLRLWVKQTGNRNSTLSSCQERISIKLKVILIF